MCCVLFFFCVNLNYANENFPCCVQKFDVIDNDDGGGDALK